MNKTSKIALGIIMATVACGFLVISQADNDNVEGYGCGDADTHGRSHADLWNRHMVDTAVSMLRSGYIVLRLGQGADSYLLSQMNQKNKNYSHCGIVMVENGYPFVYHSIGGEDNPDARMRRDSAVFFFSPPNNMGIALVHYDMDDKGVSRLRNVVYEYYRQRPKFDLKFDLKTDDHIYCAELVYKAVNKAMQDSGYIKPTSAMGYTFVGIDDLFLNPHAAIVWQTKFK